MSNRPGPENELAAACAQRCRASLAVVALVPADEIGQTFRRPLPQKSEDQRRITFYNIDEQGLTGDAIATDVEAIIQANIIAPTLADARTIAYAVEEALQAWSTDGWSFSGVTTRAEEQPAAGPHGFMLELSVIRERTT